jgi:hypothetical protein
MLCAQFEFLKLTDYCMQLAPKLYMLFVIIVDVRIWNLHNERY